MLDPSTLMPESTPSLRNDIAQLIDTGETEEDCCAICLDQITSTAARPENCQHIYHRPCLETLASRYQLRCPTCRRDFRLIVPIENGVEQTPVEVAIVAPAGGGDRDLSVRALEEALSIDLFALRRIARRLSENAVSKGIDAMRHLLSPLWACTVILTLAVLASYLDKRTKRWGDIFVPLIVCNVCKLAGDFYLFVYVGLPFYMLLRHIVIAISQSVFVTLVVIKACEPARINDLSWIVIFFFFWIYGFATLIDGVARQAPKAFLHKLRNVFPIIVNCYVPVMVFSFMLVAKLEGANIPVIPMFIPIYYMFSWLIFALPIGIAESARRAVVQARRNNAAHANNNSDNPNTANENSNTNRDTAASPHLGSQRSAGTFVIDVEPYSATRDGNASPTGTPGRVSQQQSPTHPQLPQLFPDPNAVPQQQQPANPARNNDHNHNHTHTHNHEPVDEEQLAQDVMYVYLLALIIFVGALLVFISVIFLSLKVGDKFTPRYFVVFLPVSIAYAVLLFIGAAGIRSAKRNLSYARFCHNISDDDLFILLANVHLARSLQRYTEFV